jgi:hypothetical protein
MYSKRYDKKYKGGKGWTKEIIGLKEILILRITRL